MTSLEQKTLKSDAIANIRIVEAILRRWDPVGVKPGQFAPADEYDSYAPHVVSMVAGGCSPEDLAAHLEYLSINTLGVGSNCSASAKFAAEIIRTLQPSNTSVERTRAK